MRKGYPMDIIFALLLLLAFGSLCFFIRFCEIQTKDTRMIFLLVLSLILALYLFYALFVGGKIKCRKRKIKCRIFATNYLSFNLKLKL